jgi:hypothetical protein
MAKSNTNDLPAVAAKAAKARHEIRKARAAARAAARNLRLAVVYGIGALASINGVITGMGLGTSLVLIAIGPILDFAVSVNTPGFNVHTVGVVLMVVGALGVLLSLVFWNSWGGFADSRSEEKKYCSTRKKLLTSEGTGAAP